MLTTAQVKQAIENTRGEAGWELEGSIESGRVVLIYSRPNGLQLGVGFKDHKYIYKKRDRKWDTYCL